MSFGCGSAHVQALVNKHTPTLGLTLLDLDGCSVAVYENMFLLAFATGVYELPSLDDNGERVQR